MYANRKTLRCSNHARTAGPCVVADFRARDQKNAFLDRLVRYCAGRGAEIRLNATKQRRIIGALDRRVNLAFASAQQALLDDIIASIRRYRILKKGSEAKIRLRYYLDVLLDKLVDNPHQVWSPTAPDISDLDFEDSLSRESDAILNDIWERREFERRRRNRRTEPYRKLYKRKAKATMTILPAQFFSSPGQDTPPEDFDNEDDGLEMGSKGPRSSTKVSLSQIEDNAALQPTIPFPVHPHHIGQRCRARADSNATFETNISNIPNDGMSDDADDDLTDIVEEEPQEPSKTVPSGYTLPPKDLAQIHQSRLPKHLATTTRREPLEPYEIYVSSAKYEEEAGHADDLLFEPNTTPYLPPKPLSKQGISDWQRKHDKIHDQEVRKRANDHRMAASPERGWNANRIYASREEFMGGKLPEKKRISAREEKKEQRKIERSRNREFGYTTTRMLDEQKHFMGLEEIEDIQNARKANEVHEQELRSQVAKHQEDTNEAILAQAHRDRAFVPNLGTSFISRSIMNSRERGQTMDSMEEAVAAAYRAREQQAVAAADASKKKGPRVRFEVEQDEGERKDISDRAKAARSALKAKVEAVTVKDAPETPKTDTSFMSKVASIFSPFPKSKCVFSGQSNPASSTTTASQPEQGEGTCSLPRRVPRSGGGCGDRTPTKVRAMQAPRTPRPMMPDYSEPASVAFYAAAYAAQATSSVQSKSVKSPIMQFPAYHEADFASGSRSGPSVAKQAASYGSEPDSMFEDPTMPTIRATPVTSVTAPRTKLGSFSVPEDAVGSDESDEGWNPNFMVDRRAARGQYSPGGTRIV